jgi:adenylate kinase
LARVILVLLGPPGSGKGTHASFLEREFSTKKISTGDLLRDAVAQGTELGAKAEGYMRSGGLVPDEIMLSIMGQELSNREDGIVLDGFPRTVAQAQGLAKILGSLGRTVDIAIYLNVNDDVVIRRLTSRRVCPKCGEIYNVLTMKPKVDGICDKCGGHLEIRTDDREETIRERLEVYRRQTEPVLEYYESQGNLKTLDGSGEPEPVQEELRKIVEGL